MNRAFAPTVPTDLIDPPRFSQIQETTKDVLVLELKKFLDNASQNSDRRIELPTVEKYATFGDGNDPYSTYLEVVKRYPDRLEHMPHVAVMATSGQERKLTIGTPFMSTVQDPSTITSTTHEPYALNDGDILSLRTLPDARNEFIDRIVFTADRFPSGNPIGAALAADVARVINEQAGSVKAEVVTVGGQNYVKISCGGFSERLHGRTPTEVECSTQSVNADVTLGLGRRGAATSIGGAAPNMTLTAPAGSWSSADVGRYVVIAGSQNPYFNDGRFPITAFSTDSITDTITYTNKYGRTESSTPSWFIGLRDDHRNPVHPPKNRYGMSFDLSCQIDVYAEDDNTRTEIIDLILSFFGFFLEQKFFTFMGRAGFSGQTTQGEFYQIVLIPPMQSAQEAEIPRGGEDKSGFVYANSFTINLTTTMFIDRELYFPGTNTPFVVENSNLVEDDTLPIPGVEP